MTNQNLTPYNRFKNLIKSDNVQDRFRQLLEDRTDYFLGSLLTLVTAEDKLLECDPATIFASAAKAAILRLPISKELGYAWIVPFGRKAEFIIGYKGLVQLAIRTSQYRMLNAKEIHEGLEYSEDPISGAASLNGQRTGDEVIGYLAYFQLKNGFEKVLYMSREDVARHAERYSASYQYGLRTGKKDSAWFTHFDEMGKKTVLRLLLSRYGLMSIEMVDADDKTSAIGDDPRLTVPDFSDLDEPLEGKFKPDAETVEDPSTENGKKPNGNGRPWSPEILKEKLLAGVKDKSENGWEAADKAEADIEMLRGIVASNLENCFAGHKEAKDMRHTVLMYLFGEGSTKELTVEQLVTVKRWVNAKPDSGGEWVPDKLAIKEANAAYEAGLAKEGQGKLPL